MHVEQVLLSLLSSLDSQRHKLILGWSTVNLWQEKAFNLLLGSELIMPAPNAKSIQCGYCEKKCTLDVIPHLYPDKTRYYAVCEDTVMSEQVGRITIPPEHLKQWKVSIKQLAVLIADLLSLPSNISCKADQKSIALGALKSKVAGRKSVVLNIEPLSLVVNQRELPINELIFFEGNKLSLDKEKIEHALNLKQSLQSKTYTPNVDKKEQRKTNTQAMYQDWQEQAIKLKNKHATKSKTWLSQQISKLPIAQGKSAETIRKNIQI